MWFTWAEKSDFVNVVSKANLMEKVNIQKIPLGGAHIPQFENPGVDGSVQSD